MNSLFPSHPQPLFQGESMREVFAMNIIFIHTGIRSNYHKKISHLDSLWKRDWRELGNGLFTTCQCRDKKEDMTNQRKIYVAGRKHNQQFTFRTPPASTPSSPRNTTCKTLSVSDYFDQDIQLITHGVLPSSTQPSRDKRREAWLQIFNISSSVQ